MNHSKTATEQLETRNEVETGNKNRLDKGIERLMIEGIQIGSTNTNYRVPYAGRPDGQVIPCSMNYSVDGNKYGTESEVYGIFFLLSPVEVSFHVRG